MSATLAYMAAQDDKRITSATFFATLVDFEERGELSVFIDEEQLAGLEKMMNEKGYLDGREMATTFNLLCANDLIWSFVISNYLMGKDPFPLDLLYWNSDSIPMPSEMHSFYLRKMCQENTLSLPGGIELGGVPIDLGKINMPTYVLAALEDHIAPWQSCFKATDLYSGKKTRFVLGLAVATSRQESRSVRARCRQTRDYRRRVWKLRQSADLISGISEYSLARAA